MSIKQDYLMRIIEELVNVLLENVFKIQNQDVEETSKYFEENSEEYCKLKKMIDNKEINEVENMIFDKEDVNNEENLKMALMLYKYINTKDDAFLTASNYSREEINDGIKDIINKYGYDYLVNLFM